MKLTTGILGCALVAGLMAFAPNNVQAAASATSGNIVINNTLYAPLTIKLTGSFVDSKGKISKKSVTSKEILKDLGYNNDVVLTVRQTDYHCVSVNKKSGAIVEDLSVSNKLTLSPNEVLSTTTTNGNKGAYTDTSAGTLVISFNAGGDSFTANGAYDGSLKVGAPKKDNTKNVNAKADAKNISGTGVISEADVVVTGSASVKGNGDLTLPAS